MNLHNEFTVPAPLERAWEVMLDVERVARCLPGASIEPADGDAYAGAMTIKIGPITARYRGSVRVDEADAAAHRSVMVAQGSDQGGRGTASATITSMLEEVPEGTRVSVDTDMRVTGPAAQFGRGVMQDVSAKLMRRFADCLAEEIGRAPAAAAETPAAVTGKVALPPGPAGDAAEAVARARVTAPREEALDLGEAARGAVLKRALPLAAAAAAVAVALVIRRRR
jgi:carbon monoxide dehydrogenase subunit G